MRRSLLAVLSLVCLFTVASGCRQTTNGINSTQLTPVSPLAPNSTLFPAPGSSIGPMGGSTRVPPPPTGSVSAPANNYLSSGLGAAVNTQDSVSGFASRDVVGSGVQNAGWTETGANVPQSSLAPVGYSDNAWPRQPANGQAFPLASSSQQASGSRMTMGGMQVIDLTQSAPTQGFPAPYQQTPYQQVPYPQQQYAQVPYQQPMSLNQIPASAPVMGAYDMNPSAGNLRYGATGGYAPPQNVMVQRGFEGPPSMATSSAFENVSPAYSPNTAYAPSPQPIVRSMPATQNGPSTEPAARIATLPQEDLQWRRPGTGF